MSLAEAAALVAYERAINPAVVDLARLLTIGVRIEPELVRAMRIAMFPTQDVALESDLWFSSLVQARNSTGLTFLPDVVETLRRELTSQPAPAQLDRVRDVVCRVHTGISPAIALEEEATYLAILGTSEAIAQMEQLLGRALKALLPGDPALARWVVRTLPRMPDRVRWSEAAMALAKEASRQLGGLPLRGVLDVRSAEGWDPKLIAGLQKERVGLRLLADGFEIAHPPRDESTEIEVPLTQPILLEISWPVDTGWHTQREALAPNTTRVINLPVGPLVRVRTLAGDEHRLRPTILPKDPTLLLLLPTRRSQADLMLDTITASMDRITDIGWNAVSSRQPGQDAEAVCVFFYNEQDLREVAPSPSDFQTAWGALPRGKRDVFVATFGAVARVESRTSWRDAVLQLTAVSPGRGSLPAQLREQLIALDRERTGRWIASAAAAQYQAAVSPIEGPELVGREDVLNELTRLCSSPFAGAFVLVTGDAGVGKSAVLRGFARQRRSAGQTVCYRDVANDVRTSQDDTFGRLAQEVRSLVRLNSPLSPYPTERLRGVLDEAVTRKKVSQESPLFLIVDGLDGPERADDPLEILRRYLPAVLPRHVFVLTSTRRSAHTTGRFDLDTLTWRRSADEAIRRFWVDSPVARRHEFDDRALRDVVAFCAGNHRVSQMLHRWFSGQASGARLPGRVYRGVEAKMARRLEGVRPGLGSGLPGIVRLVGNDLEGWSRPERDEVDRVLRWLSAARDELPIADLLPPSAEPSVPLTRILQAIDPLLVAHDAGAERHALVDRTSLAPLLFELLLPEHDAPRAHADLIESVRGLLTRTTHASPSVQWAVAYLSRYELHHLIAADRERQAFELFGNVEHLSVLLTWLGYEGALRELQPVLTRLDQVLNQYHSRDLPDDDLLDRASTIRSVLRDEARWLRRDPGALGPLVFNAARRQGIHPDRIRDEYNWRDPAPMRLIRMVTVPSTWPPVGNLDAGFRGHRAGVAACAPAPGGRFVSVSRDATIRCWVVPGGEESWRVLADAPLTTVAVSAKSGVVSGGANGSLNVVALDSGKLTNSILDQFSEAITACDTDNRLLLAAARDGKVKLWRRVSGEWLLSADQSVETPILGCAITKRDLLLIGVDDSFCVNDSLVPVSTVSGEPAVAAHVDRARAVALIAEADGTPRWIRMSKDKRLVSERVTSISWPSPATRHASRACAAGEDWVAVSAGDVIHVMGSGRNLVLRGHRDTVRGLTALRLSDREVLVSASEDHTLRSWDPKTGTPIQVFGRYGPPQQLLDVATGGRNVVFVSEERRVSTVTLESESAPARRSNLRAPVTAVAFGDPTLVLAGLADGRVVPFNTGVIATRYSIPSRHHSGAVTAMGWDASTRTLASGAEDGSIILWSLMEENFHPAADLAGHRAAVRRIVARDDVWISCADDGLVCEWHKSGGAQRRRLEYHEGPVRWFDVSPDGRMLATAGADGTSCLWSIGPPPWPEPRTIHTGDRGMSACAISPDARILALGGDDGRITVWEIGTGRQIMTLEGHTRSVSGLAFVFDQLVSWSLDRTVRQWDLGTHSLFSTTYGVAPFVSARIAPAAPGDTKPGPICALDALGLLWVLDYILPT